MLSDVTAPHEAGIGDGPASLAALFAAQAAATPDAIAVRTGERVLTYGQLDLWSGRLAAQLADRGVRPGGVVALAADRGPAALAGVLAVLRTGAGHLGLDPAIPARRQRRMIEETAPDCVLAEPGLDQFPTLDAPRVRLTEPTRGPVLAPRDPADDDPSAVFHIVYTSGTTGDPKGVRIGCRAVLNRLRWMWRDHPFEPGAVLAVQKSVSLVASPWELLGGLLRGVPSVFLTREEVLDPALFADAFERERVTHLFLTPHLVTGLLDEADRRGGLAHRPVLVTSGADALPTATVHRFRATFPGTTLLNLYGMTETASNVAAYDTAALAPDADRVPVGKAVAGASLTVHDRYGRLLPPGVVGEVWVAGTPLALGYVRAAGDRFTTGDDGVRRYRTGDRGRLSAGGDLEIVGRVDNQVKIRGYRVELEEIEATLRKNPSVAEAGVFVTEEQGEPRLVACVTEAAEADPAALRAFLRDRLPDYMLPSRIVVLPNLPLGPNGKLDRVVLGTIAENAAQGPRERFAPADETESVVLGLWERLLGTAPATPDDNFFDAGGHSLLAVRFANRLETAFGKRISLRRLLGSPTFSGVVELCRDRDGDAEAGA
ncbi:non-ribosomal peptide synthetase [Streptomyces uncialis]|uniref:non-ribosomal peptide synthetase n=1 Tax=Streptomyces uncialis TaxID=1048205 RepID=UPI00224FFC13|nr:non-ribosomal peptide synthetase [Streptomyces uncialis]MCX4658010.1 non-ribosomal peptide synthetase [Streptomyces uncialis]